jgi:hypothetical protein
MDRLACPSRAAVRKGRVTLAACLIVKNESRVLRRCLDSVRDLVDAAVIVDTGSTDDTVAIIRSLDYPRPIHPHERPWVHFAHNRTELLRLAAPVADYLLLLDADQTAEGTLPPLTADGYHLPVRRGPLAYENLLLVRSALPWRYEGVTHEYLTCEGASPPRAITTLSVTDHNDGGGRPAGTQPRWEWDAAVLERELQREPGHPRNVFYLARSYDDLASTRPEHPRAAEWSQQAQARYRQRAAMTSGHADEAYYSLYRLGVLRLAAGDGLALLLEAWQRCPHRWEPAHEACRWLNGRGLYVSSYALSKQALAQPPRPGGLFVTPDVYDHLLAFEHSISAYYVGAFRESYDLCRALLRKTLPPPIDGATRRNLVFPEQKLRNGGCG